MLSVRKFGFRSIGLRRLLWFFNETRYKSLVSTNGFELALVGGPKLIREAAQRWVLLPVTRLAQSSEDWTGVACRFLEISFGCDPCTRSVIKYLSSESSSSLERPAER